MVQTKPWIIKSLDLKCIPEAHVLFHVQAQPFPALSLLPKLLSTQRLGKEKARRQKDHESNLVIHRSSKWKYASLMKETTRSLCWLVCLKDF